METMGASHYALLTEAMEATATMLATKALQALSRTGAMKAMSARLASEAKEETVGITGAKYGHLALLSPLARLSHKAPHNGRHNWVMVRLPPRPAVGLQRPPSWSGGWPR